jgi:8-oxo-dGTP pyrophosphatase MutT (NUDIX family)
VADTVLVALALLVRRGRGLLVHRHPSRRHYPDCWDLAGGHIEPGELPHQTVVRECLEELGVHVYEPRPLVLTGTDPGLEVHAFVVTRWDGDPVNTAPDEHDDLHWFLPEEITDLTLAHPRSLRSIQRAVRQEPPEPVGGYALGR